MPKIAVLQPTYGVSFDERYHPLTLLVPKLQLGALEAVSNPKGDGLLEGRFCCIAGWQIVIRNTAIKVMDMVEADVAGEPLQNAR